MIKIGTVNKTKEILAENDFLMKKKFGQNFLIDQNILASIVAKAEINKNVNVIEVGPGIGSLTEHLIENAAHVISYEIDDTLIPILTKQFKEKDNFTLLHQDILKADIEKDAQIYFKNDYPIYLVANLPYYITTPIVMHLLENIPMIKRYVVMVQLEVADRFSANKGTKDYNGLTVAIKYRANVSKVLNVSRNVFMPKPNVDSAVVKFDIKENKEFNLFDEKFFFKLIRNSFANRRKTLVNNLNQAYHLDKSLLEKMLEELKINVNIRSEALDVKDFVDIANSLINLL